MILLRFENGARGAVSISQISAGRKNSLQYEIDGSESALAWDSEQPDQLWLGHREHANEILIKNPALMWTAVARRRRSPAATWRDLAIRLRRFPRRLRRCPRRRGRARPRYADLRRRPRRDARERRHRRELALGRWVDVVRERAAVACRSARMKLGLLTAPFP